VNTKPILGVSACLLGQPVRFDGGHKKARYITETLSEYFELLPVCPEVEAGLGVPRPTIQLRQNPENGEVRLINPRLADADITDSMRSHCKRKVEGMANLAGYILKKGSPTCGMERVPVIVDDNGYRRHEGVGIFAQELISRWPLLPVEEEGRLNDSQIRENFFERVYALQNWRSIENPETNVKGFIEFHASYKLLIMSRGSHYYQELGRMVAGTTKNSLVETREAYIRQFMEIMSIRPSRNRQVNVLQHLLGYFKRDLDSSDKQELLALFDSYRRQEIPLITPVTLLRHHLRRLPNPYLEMQRYLAPCPEQLALRSYLT
jgi:uncharacterized protein YbgA (DUF1722 family)/uncharacterized protein YbbK (DUF523 family)